MNPTEEYQAQADECRRCAESALDQAEKSMWLFMQNAWMRLSDDAPKFLETVSAAQETPRERRRKKRR